MRFFPLNWSEFLNEFLEKKFCEFFFLFGQLANCFVQFGELDFGCVADIFAFESEDDMTSAVWVGFQLEVEATFFSLDFGNVDVVLF